MSGNTSGGAGALASSGRGDRSACAPAISPRLRILAHPAHANREVNPYQHLLYTSLAALGHEVYEFGLRSALTGRFDVYHLHWPETLIDASPNRAIAAARAAALGVVIARLRWNGCRVVWTAHDLHGANRRYPRTERWLWRWLLPRLDGVIYLTETSRRALEAARPGLDHVPYAVVPHGHYRDCYSHVVHRGTARRRLGLPSSGRVILFLGSISPHKNVLGLLEAFRGLTDRDIRLVIAGQYDPRERNSAFGNDLRRAIASDQRVVARQAFVPDADLQLFFAAADLFVQPSLQVLNSGSALLALSFDRPVLMRDGPAQSELVTIAGPRWLRAFEPPLDTPTLRAALEWACDLPPGSRPPLEPLDWGPIAEATERFYHHLVGGNARNRVAAVRSA